MYPISIFRFYIRHELRSVETRVIDENVDAPEMSNYIGHHLWNLIGITNVNGIGKGLDTGCVYGYCLTAYIIESDEFVSVPAKRAYNES